MKNIILGVTGGIYPPTSKSENIDTIKLLQLIFAIIFITLFIIIIKNCIDIYKQNQKTSNIEEQNNNLYLNILHKIKTINIEKQRNTEDTENKKT